MRSFNYFKRAKGCFTKGPRATDLMLSLEHTQLQP